MLREHAPPAEVEPLGQIAIGSLLMTTILDHLDHGILLLGPGGRVLHANRVARRECAQHRALRFDQGYLVALCQVDADRLARALAGADRGLRALLHFDGDGPSLSMAVLPLTTSVTADGRRGNAINLVLLSKRSGSEPLNIELFAQASGLTLAERVVLKGLSRGFDPSELALANGVAVSTVRTQIMHIRQKTRTPSLRALLSVVNNLPPVVCATEVRA